jgi:hypothetical protein
MQCPYYIHVAMQRALKLTADQAVIIQAETGGASAARGIPVDDRAARGTAGQARG